MQVNHKDRKSVGRLSRFAMMFAGRVGVRHIDTSYFAKHRQLIETAWSRLNLEGRSSTWAPFHIGMWSVVFEGMISNASTWTEEARALLEAVIWKRV